MKTVLKAHGAASQPNKKPRAILSFNEAQTQVINTAVAAKCAAIGVDVSPAMAVVMICAEWLKANRSQP